jgi:hypothetical protein
MVNSQIPDPLVTSEPPKRAKSGRLATRRNPVPTVDLHGGLRSVRTSCCPIGRQDVLTERSIHYPGSCSRQSGLEWFGAVVPVACLHRTMGGAGILPAAFRILRNALYVFARLLPGGHFHVSRRGAGKSRPRGRWRTQSPRRFHVTRRDAGKSRQDGGAPRRQRAKG